MTARSSKQQQEAIRQAVGDALEADRFGRTPTVRCPVCGTLLKVNRIPQLGVIRVNCDSGCTKFRMAYRP
jgi:hypothetical protein